MSINRASNIDWRVKLRDSTNPSEVVAFDVSPDLIETRNVSYKTIDPVHAPGQIYAYVNTMSRSFNISNIRLISRTQKEADKNLLTLWRLRGWTMPTFGKTTISNRQQENRRNYDDLRKTLIEEDTNDSLTQRRLSFARQFSDKYLSGFGVDLRGKPPAVLLLSAYSVDGAQLSTIQHISRVPVVITNMSIPYPSEVDYIPTTSGVPMPTIMSIDITLSETHSPREYEQFDLYAFKAGKLPGF